MDLFIRPEVFQKRALVRPQEFEALIKQAAHPESRLVMPAQWRRAGSACRCQWNLGAGKRSPYFRFCPFSEVSDPSVVPGQAR